MEAIWIASLLSQLWELKHIVKPLDPISNHLVVRCLAFLEADSILRMKLGRRRSQENWERNVVVISSHLSNMALHHSEKKRWRGAFTSILRHVNWCLATCKGCLTSCNDSFTSCKNSFAYHETWDGEGIMLQYVKSWPIAIFCVFKYYGWLSFFETISIMILIIKYVMILHSSHFEFCNFGLLETKLRHGYKPWGVTISMKETTSFGKLSRNFMYDIQWKNNQLQSLRSTKILFALVVCSGNYFFGPSLPSKLQDYSFLFHLWAFLLVMHEMSIMVMNKFSILDFSKILCYSLDANLFYYQELWIDECAII